MQLSRDDLEARLTASDRKHIFEALGVELDQGSAGQDGWVNGLYLPSSVSSDTNPSFCVNLETGAVKDHGSDYSGDLWTLVQDVQNCTFSNALKWVADFAGYSITASSASKWDPFKDGELVKTYIYEDKKGVEVFQVLRYEVGAKHPAYPDKTFRQRHKDASHPKAAKDGYVWQKAKKPVPFRLPRILQAISKGGVIFIVEGEKDVLTLEEKGLCATCNAGGAGKWPASFASYFNDALIVILPDNDTSGLQHAQIVAKNLQGTAQSIRTLELTGLPPKGDVTDWMKAGHTADELKHLASRCPDWEPLTSDVKSIEYNEEIGVLVSNVQREKIKWLWKGWLALGKMTILDGDPGLGKSTLYCDIAARITTGRMWPDDDGASFCADPANAGGVVIVTCEDGLADTIRPRLEEAGADLSRCLVIQVIKEKDANGKVFERVPVLPDDIPTIEKAVVKMRATLLIIDPLFAHLAGNINSFRDQDIRQALTPVVYMAEKLDVALLVVRHLNKALGGSSLYRGGGSIGIIGQARLAMLLGKNPDNGEALVLASNKSNIAKHPTSLALCVVSSENDEDVGVIRWDGTSSFHAQDLLSIPKGAKITAVDEAAEWLREQLNDGEKHKACEVWSRSNNAGLKKKTVERALKNIGVIKEQIPKGPGGKWYWSLPIHEDDQPQQLQTEKVSKSVLNFPDGQFGETDHLGTRGQNFNNQNRLNQSEIHDLFSDYQMVNSKREEALDHLGESRITDLNLDKSSNTFPQKLTSTITWGDIVRLPDGRVASVAFSAVNNRIGVQLFDADEIEFVEPAELKLLF